MRGARVIEAAGARRHFGHGTGHGIGLATHELPRLSGRAPDDVAAEPDGVLRGARASTWRARPACGSRTSSTSTRHETVELLTHFPRDVIALPA